MSIITKEVKCTTCGSYIHNTNQCRIWQYETFCHTDVMYKRLCNCANCENRCQYCNEPLSSNGECIYEHNGNRCPECNEFLENDKCFWDHIKPFCQFCNLPICRPGDTCINDHNTNFPICHECQMPHGSDNRHDGTKCKICYTLLDYGSCIYGCIDEGNICIYCDIVGVTNNYCLNCKKYNSGKFTKRAIK